MNFDIKKLTNRTNILLFIGVLIVVTSYFLPLTTSCKELLGSNKIIPTTQYGYDTDNYYVSSFFIILIIAASFLGKGSYILTMILVILGGFFTVLSTWSDQTGWGRSCGFSSTQFLHLLYCSHILIITACFENHRKRKIKNS